MINLRKVFNDTKAECLIKIKSPVSYIKSSVSFEVEKYVFLEVESKVDDQIYLTWLELLSRVREQCMDQQMLENDIQR